MFARARRLIRTLPHVPILTAVQLCWLTARSSRASLERSMAWHRHDDVRINLGAGRATWLRGSTAGADLMTFLDVFADRSWAARRTVVGRTVIDGGGHHGYFGAWALRHGAREVWSIEPASTNRQILEATAASFNNAGHRWQVIAAALAPEAGTAELALSANPWGHSLRHADHATGASEMVATRTLEDVLAAARNDRPGLTARPEATTGNERSGESAAGFVVKLDVEGLAAAVITSTSATTLEQVEDLLIEYESTITQGEIARASEHLAAAGFRLCRQRRGHQWWRRD